MIRTVQFYLSIGLALVIFVSVMILNNRFSTGIQFDLTENNIYTLSEGSKTILQAIEEPIDLYFFFSDSASKGMTSLRNYAERVERLLRTYSALSDGKIRLHIIDPEPFSVAQEHADGYGIKGDTLSTTEDALYFGLAGTNLLDNQYVIPYFDPTKEQFLEYEVSKMVYQLSEPNKPKVGVITDLQVKGIVDEYSGETGPALAVYTQLQQFFDVEIIRSSASSLPADLDIIMMLHPQPMNESLLKDVDKHVINTGKLIAFIDPYFEHAGVGMARTSDTQLLSLYGIQMDISKVVVDSQLELQALNFAKHNEANFRLLGLAAAQINQTDIVTESFERLYLSSAGTIARQTRQHWFMSPLLTTNQGAQLIMTDYLAQGSDTERLASLLSEKTAKYTIGGRFTGILNSAYLDNLRNRVNILVFADVDMLLDKYWLQQNDGLDTAIATPFTNNGDLLVNSIDNLSGTAELINIRSRGTYSRPFLKVNELKAIADEKFRKQELRLQQELAAVELELSQLRANSESQIITTAQDAALESSANRRLLIRRELRQVRLQLNRDIETLGNKLKFLNVLIFPLLLTLIASLLFRVFQARAPQRLFANSQVTCTGQVDNPN